MEQNNNLEQTVHAQFETAQTKERREAVAKTQDRLAYHLMPPVGWLNDPNGLMEHDGIVHIFYQYAPQNPEGTGKKGWGHYTTRDFIHYTEEPVALYPDTLLDAGGAYSGSGIIGDDGRLWFYYTGNRRLPGDFDYINEGRQHFTCKVDSADGRVLENKRVLLKNSDYPKTMSCHVRDPKVWKEDGKYWMVLGARTRESLGQALLYESPDGENWSLAGEIHGDENYGYMWECPDLLDLDGNLLLLTCVQGAKQTGFEFENLYPSGYFEVSGKPGEEKDLTALHFRALDHGFDFYAPQTFIDEDGRRILIGWMAIPDVDYEQREMKEGWKHALTLPRELTWKNGQIMQKPIEEMKQLRKLDQEQNLSLEPNKAVQLPDRVCEIELKMSEQSWTLSLRKDVTLTYNEHVLTLQMGESGLGRTVRHAYVDEISSLTIFSDVSSLEIFVNDGEVSMTTRVYDDADSLKLESSVPMEATIWPLKAFAIQEAK